MTPTLSFWLPLLGRLALEALLLVALAAVAQRFITSPRARGTLWQAVLLGVALVWLAELGGARGQIARWWPQPRKPRPMVVTLADPPAILVPSSASGSGSATLFPAAEEPVAEKAVWWPFQLWIAGLSALAFRALGLRLWLGFAAGRRGRVTADALLLARVENLRRRVGLRRVRVLTWPGLRSPIAFGTLRPTIALPADFAERFSPEAQDAMLAHELAHVAASDPFWLAIADVVLALAWWHPAVWWARRQLRAASEATADEASALVPGGRVALAESLVNFGRELAAPGWTRGLGVAGDGLKSQLARRVTALLRPTTEWRAVRPARLWMARGAALITTAIFMAVPWPGASGPTFAEVLLAATAASAQAASAAETPPAGLAPANSPGEPPPAPSAAPHQPVLVQHYSTSPAWPVAPLGATAGSLENPAHLSYEAAPTRSSSSGDHPGLALTPPPSVGFLPDADPKSPHQQYVETARQFRLQGEQIAAFSERIRKFMPADETNIQAALCGFFAANGVKFPEHGYDSSGKPVWQSQQSAIFFDDRTGVIMVRAKTEDLDRIERAIQMLNLPPAPAAQATPGNPEPEENSTVQARYQLALQAVKQADLEAVPIIAKYGKDSAEAAAATARYQRAKEKAQLLQAANDSFQRLEVLGKSYEPVQPKTTADRSGRNDLLAKLEGTTSETTNAASLYTRQFKFSGHQLAAFNEHIRQFLPAGETNFVRVGENGLTAAQFGARAFCVTNGVDMQMGLTLPTQQSNKAVFFNDRSGVLFVRATLEDLDRIERAIQTVDIPPAEADEIRAGQMKTLKASEARLAELRTRYHDRHPKVLEELASQAQIRASLRNMELNGRTAATNGVLTGASTNSRRQVVLETQFAEVTERSSDDLGLDWIFGLSPTNNPALQSGPATNLLTEPGSPHGQALKVDLLRTVGESATLTEVQFTALRKRLESRGGVDFLAAPRVITQSGREAQVSVGEEKTIVTDMQEQQATATNQAGIRYQTEKVTLGPKVDIIPVLEGAEMRLGIVATVTEFLGYDQPVASPAGKPAKAVKGVEPLPRMRVRALHADSVSKSGETVALRGPLVADTVLMKDKVPVLGDVPLLGRLFRSESRSTQRKRLYVFITATEVTAAGERVP